MTTSFLRNFIRCWCNWATTVVPIIKFLKNMLVSFPGEAPFKMGVMRPLEEGAERMRRDANRMSSPLAGAHNHGLSNVRTFYPQVMEQQDSTSIPPSYTFSFVMVGVAAVFMLCFSCWLRRLLSKRRAAREDEENEKRKMTPQDVMVIKRELAFYSLDACHVFFTNWQ